ncbi:hypothetical protein WA158_000773 [Blastocystis sp. Blastoise]
MSVVKKEMMMYCFDTLLNKLIKYPMPKPEFDTNLEYGIFVTLEKKVFKQYELRGCIGNLSPISLSSLSEYALYSAFEDNRFHSLNASELPKLRVEVSLLYDFEDRDNVMDWEVGKHGIYIFIPYKHRILSATFLPEVAEEQGWDKKTTLDYLAEKAGFFKPLTEEVLQTIKLRRYKTEKAYLTFSEYIKMTKARGRDALPYFESLDIPVTSEDLQ